MSLGLYQPEKSAMAQHALEEHRNIKFDEIIVLVRASSFFNLVRRKALEMEAMGCIFAKLGNQN